MDVISEKIELVIRCIYLIKDILNIVMEFLPSFSDKSWVLYNGSKRK